MIQKWPRKKLFNLTCKILILSLILSIAPFPLSWTGQKVALADEPTATVKVLIKPNVTTGKDGRIISSSPNYNYGASNTTYIGINDARRNLIQFDLSSIPSDASVTGSSLKMYCYNTQQLTTRSINIHRTARNWLEGTGNGSATNNGATWNTYDGVNAWTTPGGDYNSNTEASTGVSGAGYYNWDVAGLVQSWHNGTYPNYGMLMKMASNSYSENKSFYTSEQYNVDPSKAPQLEIIYTEADTASPSVNLISPVSGQRVSAVNKMRIEAIDNVDLSKVEIYIDGTLRDTKNRPTQYIWKNAAYYYSWDTAAIDGNGNRLYADGSHSVYVIAYDTAGNITQTSAKTVIVDNSSTTMTVTLQPNAASGKDVEIRSSYPEYNYGASYNVGSMTYYQNNIYRSMFQFDLSTIPANAAITDADFKLYCSSTGGLSPANVNVHQVTHSWVEGTGLGSATHNGATWFTYDGVNSWSTPGGDFNFDPESTIGVAGTGTFYAWDIMGLAQRWHNSSTSNYGVIIKRDELWNESGGKNFFSSDLNNASQRSQLVVTYTVDSIPPTVHITSPLSNENISGNYVIKGTINDVDFKDAIIEYGQGPDPTTWTEIATITSPVNNGDITTWDTSGLSGEYTLRFTATDNSNNVEVISGSIYVSSFPWDIEFEDTLGDKPTCGFFGEPVNTGNGNYTASFTDLSIPSKGFAIKFDRSYNSLDNMHNGALGFGWTHSYEQALGIDDDTITVLLADGRRQKFTSNGDRTFSAPADTLEKLIENADGTYSYIYKDQSSMKFNSDGELTDLIDRYGNSTTLSYTGHKLTTVTAPGQKTLNITYEDNHISRIQDNAGRHADYGYDEYGNLVSFTDPNGNATTYTYDEAHQLLTINEPEQTEHPFLTNHYANGKVDYQFDAFQNENTYAYDSVNNKTDITDNCGSTLTHYFDNALRMTRQTNEVGGNRQFTFNSLGLVESVTNENTQTSYFDYDANGNITQTTDTAGHTTKASYDSANNNLLYSEDANGIRTTYDYDQTGKFLNSITNPIITTQFQYYEDGLLHYLFSDDATTTYEYDEAGNPNKVIDPIGKETDYVYDDAGRLTSSVDANGHTTRFSYDAKGNILITKDPLSIEFPNDRHQVDYTYDDNGNKETFTDSNNNMESIPFLVETSMAHLHYCLN